MSDLRSRLEAKARRCAVLPVQVSDPGDAARRVAELERQAVFVASGLVQRTDEQRALDEEALADARAQLAEHVVDVELQALAGDAFEQITSAFPGTDPGEDGGMDWRAALPALLAASAVDEDLRDVDWWTEQLAADHWAHGERLKAWQTVLALNTRTPAPRLGKG